MFTGWYNYVTRRVAFYPPENTIGNIMLYEIVILRLFLVTLSLLNQDKSV